MIDFYFVTTVVNMFWQIFTVLFVLYRFTSFFSLIYNFIKFIGKILQSFVYIKNQITLYFRKRSGYSVLNQDEINGLPTQRQTPRTLFTKIYDWFYGKITRNNDRLPLYETRTSYYDINNVSLSDVTKYHDDNDDNDDKDNLSLYETKQPRNDVDFENHMHSLLQSSDFRRSDVIPSFNYNDSFNHNDFRGSDCGLSRSSNYDDKSTVKPFNVEDSNMLFNSNFLTNIFTNKKISVELPTDIYKRENDIEVVMESEYELTQSLLNSNQDYSF